MGEELDDPEILSRIEAKLDRLLSIYERFAPLLDRLGGGLLGQALVGRATARRIGTPPRPPAAH